MDGMTKDKWLDQDWSETYEQGQWHRDGGNFHSLSWMVSVLTTLSNTSVGPDVLKYSMWSREEGGIRYMPCTIHDYGCGEGDGTMFLRTVFPFAQVKGIDFWPKAIETCRERWTSHDIRWEVGDVTEVKEPCDLLFCIQTMDHVDDIPAAINGCLEKSKIFVMAWADLPHQPKHPSQDLSWMLEVPKPTLWETFLKPRIVPLTGQVIHDVIQLFVWVSS